MNCIEQLAEVRGLYARAVNEFNCTPKDDVRKRRLRQLLVWSLAHAVDTLERIEGYPMQQTPPLPEVDRFMEAL